MALEKDFHMERDWLQPAACQALQDSVLLGRAFVQQVCVHSAAARGLLARILGESTAGQPEPAWMPTSSTPATPARSPCKEGPAAPQRPSPACATQQAPHELPSPAPSQPVPTGSPQPPREPRLSLICTQRGFQELINFF